MLKLYILAAEALYTILNETAGSSGEVVGESGSSDEGRHFLYPTK
jgi:hypothetical protein